jgi:hypothetical protein
MGKASTMNGEKRNTCSFLVGKSGGKISLGRPKHERTDNIKTDLGERGWDGVGWIDLA